MDFDLHFRSDLKTLSLTTKDFLRTMTRPARDSLKVIKKFFKTITKDLDPISAITKNIFFFHLSVCEWRNFDFLCVLTDV